MRGIGTQIKYVSIMSKRKNAYSATVFELNKRHKADKRYSNRINYLNRNLMRLKKDMRESLEEAIGSFETKKKTIAKKFMNIFLVWLFVDATRFDLIRSMIPKRPEGDRSAKDLLKKIAEGENLRSLKVSDSEKIDLGDVTGEPGYDGKFIGGISVFRLIQIAYGIHKYVLKDLGDGYKKSDLSEKKVIGYINQYHNDRNSSYRAKETEEKQNDDEPIIQDLTGEFVESEATAEETLERLENGDLSTTDLESVDLMNEIYELAPRGIKGAITKRKKALVE